MPRVRPAGRRSKELKLTDAGAKRLQEACEAWGEAQARSAKIFGPKRTRELRALLHDALAAELPAFFRDQQMMVMRLAVSGPP
jgi:hypothetical protein